MSLLEVTRIADGLWRWTAPHPEWTPEKDKPGGWGRMVGAVYCEPPAGSSHPVVLIDPLAPPEGSPEAAKFWAALDRDLERAGRPVAVLIGNGYHLRSARDVERRYAARYGVTTYAHPGSVARLGFEPGGRFGPGPSIVAGVDALPIEGLGDDETAFFIRAHRTLVFADAVVGTGGGRLAVVPASWAPEGDAARALYHERFRASIGRLAELDPAIVLPSHGEPALARGRDALAAALSGPAWGE